MAAMIKNTLLILCITVPCVRSQNHGTAFIPYGSAMYNSGNQQKGSAVQAPILPGIKGAGELCANSDATDDNGDGKVDAKSNPGIYCIEGYNCEFQSKRCKKELLLREDCSVANTYCKPSFTTPPDTFGITQTRTLTCTPSGRSSSLHVPTWGIASIEGRCLTELPLGGDCDKRHTFCGAGLTCRDKYCKLELDAGGNCGSFHKCSVVAGNTNNQVCEAYNSWTYCKDGLRCISGHCKEQMSLGEPCNRIAPESEPDFSFWKDENSLVLGYSHPLNVWTDNHPCIVTATEIVVAGVTTKPGCVGTAASKTVNTWNPPGTGTCADRDENSLAAYTDNKEACLAGGQGDGSYTLGQAYDKSNSFCKKGLRCFEDGEVVGNEHGSMCLDGNNKDVSCVDANGDPVGDAFTIPVTGFLPTPMDEAACMAAGDTNVWTTYTVETCGIKLYVPSTAEMVGTCQPCHLKLSLSVSDVESAYACVDSDGVAVAVADEAACTGECLTDEDSASCSNVWGLTGLQQTVRDLGAPFDTAVVFGVDRSKVCAGTNRVSPGCYGSGDLSAWIRIQTDFPFEVGQLFIEKIKNGDTSPELPWEAPPGTGPFTGIGSMRCDAAAPFGKGTFGIEIRAHKIIPADWVANTPLGRTAKEWDPALTYNTSISVRDNLENTPSPTLGFPAGVVTTISNLGTSLGLVDVDQYVDDIKTQPYTPNGPYGPWYVLPEATVVKGLYRPDWPARSPARISQGVASKIRLMQDGAIKDGDNLVWASDCGDYSSYGVAIAGSVADQVEGDVECYEQPASPVNTWDSASGMCSDPTKGTEFDCLWVVKAHPDAATGGTWTQDSCEYSYPNKWISIPTCEGPDAGNPGNHANEEDCVGDGNPDGNTWNLFAGECQLVADDSVLAETTEQTCVYDTKVEGGTPAYQAYRNFTINTVGAFKLCYNSTHTVKNGEAAENHERNSVAQQGILLEVVAATAAITIKEIEPSSITADTPTLISLKPLVKEGDRLTWTTGECAAVTPWMDPVDSTILVASAQTTFSLPLVDATTTTYKLCYTRGTDSVEQTSVSLTVQASTPDKHITAISPVSVSAGVPTPIQLTGEVAAGDLIVWHRCEDADCSAADCATAVPAADPEDGADAHTTFTLSAVGSYVLCVRMVGGSDSVKQTDVILAVVEQTKPNVITAITPTVTTIGTATSITLTDNTFAANDMAVFAFDCDAYQWPTAADAATTIPGPALATATADFTPTKSGVFKLCYRSVGGSDSVVQTGVTLTVNTSSTVISAIALADAATRATMEVEIEITMTGTAVADDKVAWLRVPAGVASSAVRCSTVAPDLTPTAGTDVATAFTLAKAGMYKLCYTSAHTAGGTTDSVEQTGITLEVISRPDVITEVSPVSVSAGYPTSLKLTGTVGRGDQVAWALECDQVTAADGVPVTKGDDKSTTFVVSDVNPAYKLCYKSEGGLEFIDQPDVRLKVVAATLFNTILQIVPDTAEAGETSKPIKMIGTVVEGDMGVWSTNCNTAVPNIAMTASSADVDVLGGQSVEMTFDTMPTEPGHYYFCYRSKEGSDSIMQGVTLMVFDKCVTPTNHVGYLFTETVLTKGSEFNVTAECDAAHGFTASTAQDPTTTACSTAGQPYTFAGCEQTDCITPASTKGYSVTETDMVFGSSNQINARRLQGSEFDVTAECDASVGYTGSATVAECDAAGHAYVLDGCSLTRCLRPDVDTDTAYDITENDLDFGDGWNVTVTCQKSGTVVLAKCNAPGQPYYLTGC